MHFQKVKLLVDMHREKWRWSDDAYDDVLKLVMPKSKVITARGSTPEVLSQ